jgi:hypothetical protein
MSDTTHTHNNIKNTPPHTHSCMKHLAGINRGGPMKQICTRLHGLGYAANYTHGKKPLTHKQTFNDGKCVREEKPQKIVTTSVVTKKRVSAH